MATKFGFKRMTIRILDEGNPTLGENLFVIEGEEGLGATQTAKINGLAPEHEKTYGSDITYHTAGSGVGDVNVDLGLVDVPEKIIDRVMGHKTDDGITYIGNNSKAPYCSILLESTTSKGKICAYGFFKGLLTQKEDELSTKEEKTGKLPTENFNFSSNGADSGENAGDHAAKIFDAEEATLTKLKQKLKMVA